MNLTHQNLLGRRVERELIPVNRQEPPYTIEGHIVAIYFDPTSQRYNGSTIMATVETTKGRFVTFPLRDWKVQRP